MTKKFNTRSKKLIVNADEIGSARCVTDAIWECLNKGVVTSTTIVTGGMDFDNAASLVKGKDFCGLHFSLVDFISVSPKHKIPSLLSGEGKRLYPLKEFLKRYFSNRISIGEIKIELENQIVKCLDNKINLTHVDGHCNLHVLPKIFKIVLELMEKYKIRKFRYPRESFFNIDLGQPIQYLIKLAIGLNASVIKKMVPAGITHPDHFIGLANSGYVTEDIMLKFLKGMYGGVTEIPVHPANFNKEQIDEAFGHTYYPTHFFQTGSRDKDAMLSERVKRFIRDNGIALSSYKGL